MNIGLIDADGHNYPNLPLMKLSAWHQQNGDDVDYSVYPIFKYDKIYISKVFSWTPDPMEQEFRCDNIVCGGTGYSLSVQLPEEVEHTYPDYKMASKDWQGYAIGYLTRGCSRKCPWCLVWEKEGFAHLTGQLSEFWHNQRYIQLLDPNILEYSNHLDLLHQLAETKAIVAFRQGLDIRLCFQENIEAIKRIRTNTICFAYDNKPNTAIEEAFNRVKKQTNWKRDKVLVYILVNFNTTLEEDFHRIEFIKAINFRPYVMVYDKQSLPEASHYYRLQTWVNNPLYFYTNTFDNFIKTRYKSKTNFSESYKSCG